MDVTRLSGAPRAADARAPVARDAGPGFDSFLPAPGEAGARFGGAERAERMADERRSELQRVEQRRAEKQRVAERRADERRAEERRADEARAEAREAERRAEARLAAEREAEERRVEERRAEDADAERAEAQRAARAQALEGSAEAEPLTGRPSTDASITTAITDGPQPALAAEASGLAGEPEGLRPGREPAGFARTPDASAFAGPAGLQGLVHWLESRPEAILDGPRAQRAMALAADGPAVDDAEGAEDGLQIAMSDGAAEADGELDADPTAELTRLLEGRKLAGERLEPTTRDAGRAGGDSARSAPTSAGQAGGSSAGQSGLQGGMQGLAGPGASPLTAARIADAGAAARAGSTPTALPEGVDESSIMRQISDALRLRGDRAGRAQTAEIALNPAELGRVRIKIRMQAGAARVLVSAEHAAVGDLLGSGLDQLRRDLMAQGVHVAHLEVRDGLADEGGQRRDAREHDDADDADVPEAHLETPREQSPRRVRSRIDLEA